MTQAILNKQRLDKFDIVITLPKILKNINNTDWEAVDEDTVNRDALEFSLYSANLPEVSIPAKVLPTYGHHLKVTSQVRDPYIPVTCKFVMDNGGKNYWLLWKWLDFINSSTESWMDESLAMHNDSNTTGVIPPNKSNWDYMSTITLYPLDEYNKRFMEFEFKYAFITKLSGLQFSHQDHGQAECDFTFEFSMMDLKLVKG